MTLFWCFYWLWRYFTHFSSVSIVDFEQVLAGLGSKSSNYIESNASQKIILTYVIDNDIGLTDEKFHKLQFSNNVSYLETKLIFLSHFSKILCQRSMHLNFGLVSSKCEKNSIQDRDHAFNAFAKFFEKLLFLTPWYAHVRLHIRG